jgi:N-ethylmaleimide reductase
LGALHAAGQKVQHSPPRAVTTAEIRTLVRDFAAAAANALAANFDGVELHGANGYLINQFIDSGSNHRTDQYGGSLRNRLRFFEEVTQAVIAVTGPDRVGVRLSPLTTAQGAVDATPESTYLAAARMLAGLDIAYIHIAEADWDDAPTMSPPFKEAMRQMYGGAMIYSGHYDRPKAEEAIKRGWTDMVGFGRAFIANPDLPRRLNFEAALNPGKPEFYFGGGAKGYVDYPSLGNAHR